MIWITVQSNLLTDDYLITVHFQLTQGFVSEVSSVPSTSERYTRSEIIEFLVKYGLPYSLTVSIFWMEYKFLWFDSKFCNPVMTGVLLKDLWATIRRLNFEFEIFLSEKRCTVGQKDARCICLVFGLKPEIRNSKPPSHFAVSETHMYPEHFN